ncbi:MAG: glutamyl-tRNA reductase [Acidimicrobiaceae bacterium]|nr:glutamyl-tRNA reductase [Acidimicrobiaceae bacterium]
MSVVVVGLNYRSVPLEVLEQTAVNAEQLPKALHDLSARDYLNEVVVVSTCMRTEVYAVASRYHGGINEIRKFLAAWSGAPLEDIADQVYEFHDETAAHHLFRVASGLDSAVLGEGEILGQVRDAWTAAQVERSCGPVLATLFRRAVETGKRVRSETAIARGTTSLSQAALAMATERLGFLVARTTLVIGAGEMGEAMAVALGGALAAGDLPGSTGGALLVANRTAGRAAALAARAGGSAVAWEHLSGAVVQADLVLASTAAAEVVLDAATLRSSLAERGGRPLLIVDIGVPRNVDPAVGELDGVTLLDIDDLRAFVDVAMEGRRAELPAAEAIVAEEVERHVAVAAEREVTPLVVALRDRGETVRLAELRRFTPRLAELDERQWRAVEALTRGIVAKLLHEPTVGVKAQAGSVEGEQLAAALKKLFEL